MRHTTRIELINQYDLVAVKLGVMNVEEVRRLTVTDALVDTGATGLCLPTSLIERLGLTPIKTVRARAATGIIDRILYSAVEFTILERTSLMQITDLPEGSPVLVGHMVLEHLDLCLDIKKGLIYNPAHDGEWITEIL
ncbi:MAG: retropepsin-like aspartic protease [Candidatus Poribacteria bacterium]|nr:retropepsin-like aspartic protease [Candidatus Poribacteria bacterium]